MRFLLITCGALFGSVVAQANEAKIVKMTPQMTKEAQAAVRSALKDPESARFGGMAASDDGVVIHVCGFVNAKNSYGGYTGEQPFYAVGGKKSGRFAALGVGGDQARQTATLLMCKKAGLAGN